MTTTTKIAGEAMTDEWRTAFDDRHEFDVYPEHFMSGLRNEFAAGWHAAMKSQARALLASKPAVVQGWMDGVEAVAKMLDKKADDYACEYGSDDMGSLSFGQGNHADAKRDYHSSLIELAEEVRAMIPADPHRCNLPPTGWQCSRDAGHSGPCAASPTAPAQPMLEKLAGILASEIECDVFEQHVTPALDVARKVFAAPAQPCGEDAADDLVPNGLLGLRRPDDRDAENGAIGEPEFDQWFKTRGVWPRLTYLEVWQASRAALTAEKAAGQSVDEIRRAVWREAHSVCLEGVKWTPEPSKEVQFYIKGTCHRLAAEISSRAGLIDGKAAGQEPVSDTHINLFRPSTGDVFKALRTDSIDELLHDGWEISSQSQPAQSAEQDEPCTNCGMSVDPKCACERGRKRAASTQSTATQPAVGWFVQRSEFGPWVEVEHQEPGAEQFYRIAAQPVQTQVALTDDARDAARYRWLRQQQWNAADMFVVAGSKSQVRLGTDCPSLVRLDDAIDAALTAAQPVSGGEA
jgi:hypothetical protein